MQDRLKKPRVVLVEDNPADIYLVREAVTEHKVPAELLAFQYAPDAWKYFQQAESPPELLLVDINLIDANGLDLLQELRAIDRYSRLPAAVLSSSVSSFDRERAASLKVLRFIEKPPTLDEFISVVGGAIHDLLREGPPHRGHG